MQHLSPSQRAQAIGPRISVSSFSLRAELGEIRVPIETKYGELDEFVLPSAGTLAMTEFPRQVRARLGVQAVELCQIQLGDAPIHGVDELAASLDQHAVAVTAVPIDIGNIANPDDARRESYLAAIRPWIDIAAQLAAPFARVNAGAPIGAPNSSRPALVSALRSLADYASSVDVSLLVENHGGPSSDPDWLVELLEAVGRDRLGLILDTGNFEPMLSAAEARHAGQPLDEASIDFEQMYEKIAKLAPFATLVHAKAYDVLDDGTFGPVDLRRSLNVMRDSGYDGPVTIEYEGQSDNPWACTARMVSLVREVFGRDLHESIQHTVAFRLRHPAGSNAETNFLSAARALADIPGVQDFRQLRQVSLKSDFTHFFTMRFSDIHAYRAYNDHPVHVAFVRDRWDAEVSKFQELDLVDRT